MRKQDPKKGAPCYTHAERLDWNLLFAKIGIAGSRRSGHIRKNILNAVVRRNDDASVGLPDSQISELQLLIVAITSNESTPSCRTPESD